MPLTTFSSDWMPVPDRARGYDGAEIFAIGDLHGHREHFDRLFALVTEEAAKAAGKPPLFVALGDTIDRGPDSLGCLKDLVRLKARLGPRLRCLKGNHDQYLIELLFNDEADFDLLGLWLANGGGTTLAEMGIETEDLYRSTLKELSGRMRQALGGEIVTFLERLELSVRAGPFLFVHAGLDPARPEDGQDWADLLTIREPFLSCRDWPFDFVAVHGHSIFRPHIAEHRIAVDSGCYRTGVLTALQIRGDAARFLCVASEGALSAFDKLRRVGEAWPGRPWP